MTATPPKIDVPWFVFLLVGVVVIGSAIVATASIGAGYAALHLPAVLTYALPVAMHLAAVTGTWARARSINLRLQRATRQGLIAIAAILMVVSTLTTQLRLGRWDLLAMVVTGVVSGAGPLTLALVFFRPHRATTT